jgi:carbonic anhydrase
MWPMPLPEDWRVAADRFEASFAGAGLAREPQRQLAVVTCMDSRIDLFALLGLGLGQAHVLRNAGARATDDLLRSLALSHWALGTREAVVIGHTDCGLEAASNEELRARIGPAAEGVDFLPFADVEDAVRDSVYRILASPLLPDGYRASGFVYDVRTGNLRELEDL